MWPSVCTSYSQGSYACYGHMLCPNGQTMIASDSGNIHSLDPVHVMPLLSGLSTRCPMFSTEQGSFLDSVCKALRWLGWDMTQPSRPLSYVRTAGPRAHAPMRVCVRAHQMPDAPPQWVDSTSQSVHIVVTRHCPVSIAFGDPFVVRFAFTSLSPTALCASTPHASNWRCVPYRFTIHPTGCTMYR